MLLGIIGIILFISSFIYLAFHFIKKQKDKERNIPFKVFLSLLASGFVLILLGVSFSGESNTAQLEEQELKIEELTIENENLKQENLTLTEEVENLQSEKTRVEQELASKNSEFQTLNEKASNHASEVDDLHNKIAELMTTIAQKEKEISTLNANAEEQAVTTSKDVTSSASESDVYYKNCTVARDAGAAPVRTGDPGYASHLDRDGDGVGCE
ncbi:hypothetical protein F9U64_21140 [Gracilibacillus oryzae]|uniref:Excalibur calcium-binding domain-containing protein n=1 Tax=Gracilibacillus oryzae TaxID=1672701 RepID=A0A7C8L0U3_9BACI|nr:excalibur calcium-binding domain-containing protein [Gracilibacillus oryzae]KAB8125980.1 hypothetical protein F9U64_21140 [Gracilibacillus oryzae]